MLENHFGESVNGGGGNIPCGSEGPQSQIEPDYCQSLTSLINHKNELKIRHKNQLQDFKTIRDELTAIQEKINCLDKEIEVAASKFEEQHKLEYI